MLVLEIGVGTGRHTTRLLDQKNEVVGVDASLGMLAQAQARLLGRRAKLVQGDVMTLDLTTLAQGRKFEAALSALVLEHIENLPQFFLKVNLALETGASFFISEIHPLRAKAGSLAHFVDPVSEDEVWLKSYVHDQNFFESSALQAGFDVVQAVDLLGDESLITIKPSWSKHVGNPMVKVWELRKNK